MSPNDVAMILIAIANLVLRVWEMRRTRRRNTDEPNQSGN